MGLQLIETVTLASAASSIEFTSIPQDGVDLLLVFSGRDISLTGYVEFNNDSTTYAERFLTGSGSAASSGSGTFGIALFSTPTSATANTFSNGSLYVTNYASSTAKSYSVDTVSENNATEAYQRIVAGSWTDSTSGITSIKLTSNVFQEHTSASLYKITAD